MKTLKIKSLALTTILAAPVATMLIASSCSHQPLTPSTKQLIGNENNIAYVEITFDNQPKNNEAVINLVSNSGQELELIEGVNDYSPTHIVEVKDKKALVIIGVVEKPTETVNIDFDIEAVYLNNQDRVITNTIKNMKLKIEVDPNKLIEEVHILDINDFHGCVPGFGSTLYKAGTHEAGALRLGREIKKIIDQYPGSMFLSAGDNNSGNVFSTAKHGETLYPMLKAMNVQYSAVGNHAFEWGLDPLASGQFDTWARTPTTNGNYFVAANILNSPVYKTKDTWVWDHSFPEYETDYKIWKNQIVSWADPYKILNIKGHRVCLIGLTTKLTEEDGNTDITRFLSFIDYIPAVHYAKDLCKERIGEADYNRIESFILLTHLESDYKKGIPTGAAVELAKYINTDVDAIISAHSHKEGAALITNEGDLHGKKIWVGQALKHGMRYLDTKLIFDNKKATGHKLSDISMEVKTPYIEYGGHNPDSEDPQEAAKAKEAATQEYNNLIQNPDGPFNRNIVECYKQNVQILEEELAESFVPAEYGAQYPTQGKNLGHEYIEFEHTVEQAGAWMQRACLYGFESLIRVPRDLPKKARPWVCFTNQDSITHTWEQGRMITKKDMFALQTYENKVVEGYLTIGQIVNIINYSLAGKTKFVYGEDNNVYTGRLNTDLNKNKVSGADLESTGTKDKTSCYLCGPLQFYGMKVQLQKITDQTEAEKLDATYEVAYEEKTLGGKTVKVPKIWFANPDELPGGSVNIEDPDTWLPAESMMSVEISSNQPWLIPVVISDFIYNGNLASNRMFKNYFEYCATYDPSYKPVVYTEIVRDLILEFAKQIKNKCTQYSYPEKFDITEAVTEKLVTKLNQKIM